MCVYLLGGDLCVSVYLLGWDLCVSVYLLGGDLCVCGPVGWGPVVHVCACVYMCAAHIPYSMASLD